MVLWAQSYLILYKERGVPGKALIQGQVGRSSLCFLSHEIWKKFGGFTR